MMACRLTEIALVLNAKLIGDDCTVLSIITNSKLINYNDRCLFIALKGEHYDAHNFAFHAVNKGAVALLVNRFLPFTVPQLIVTDTIFALKTLASWVRRQSSACVIAITGSSGKTSVKEMTSIILRQYGLVLSTKGNLNNCIGVALTLLRLTVKHQFVVIEIGANHIGEISQIIDFVQPEITLVNNLFASHLIGFGSISNIAKAKGEIFSGTLPNGQAVLNADSHAWEHWKYLLQNKKIWRFSLFYKKNIDCYTTNIVHYQYGTKFVLQSPIGNYPVWLPLLGIHSVTNALAASTLALSVGIPLSVISFGLSQLHAIPGRLFPIHLGPGRLLIDDSYNANVGSMIAAAHVLSKMPGYRVMIVGDMAELGYTANQYHSYVGHKIALLGIDKILSSGQFSYLISTASNQGEHYNDNISLIYRLTHLLSKYKLITILVKGSRSSKMEYIVNILQRKILC